MKRKLIIAFILSGISCLAAHGQSTTKDTTRKDLNPNDTTWKINVLQAPSSPGASLLGISPSVIQTPTDPAAFATSLLNATNNLTVIPSSYAVDFAPAWLFGGQHITFEKYKSNAFKDNIWQNFVVSFAFQNVKDTVSQKTNTSAALGFKISLIRGTINKKATDAVKQVGILTSNLQKLRADQQHQLRNTPAYSKASPTEKGHLIDSVDAVAKSTFSNAKAGLDSLKKLGEQIDFSRVGWQLDLAGGMSWLFPGQASGAVNNAGLWLTGGHQPEGKGLAVLGIVRYLYNPKQAYADANNVLNQTNLGTLDGGLRLLYESKEDKFTFGTEFIYRSILNNSTVGSSWRYTLSTDYLVGKNQIISFVFGRDFNGTITKGGSLVAALNFVLGFGSSKAVH